MKAYFVSRVFVQALLNAFPKHYLITQLTSMLQVPLQIPVDQAGLTGIKHFLNHRDKHKLSFTKDETHSNAVFQLHPLLQTKELRSLNVSRAAEASKLVSILNK